MLVDLSTLLKVAKKENYAVGAFNAADFDTARGIIAAAEEKNSPVILQFAEVHSQYVKLEQAAAFFLELAEQAKVPVCVHFDHGISFEAIVKAMKLGFTSVMVDTSTLPLAENIARTKEIVKIAKPLGISVEAELGVMNREDGVVNLDYSKMDDTYTRVEDAKKFVEETNVDALAIAFGTIHGLYKAKPHLNFDRISEIAAEVDVPLVMHGGSGLSDPEYRQSIEHGITKINYYSTMAYDVGQELREYLDTNKEAYVHDISVETSELVKENIAKKIAVFGSADKA